MKKERLLQHSMDRELARHAYEALSTSSLPGMDAYRMARNTGLKAMECGRVLDQFERDGIAESGDEKGTENDLARVFRLRDASPGAGNIQTSRTARIAV